METIIELFRDGKEIVVYVFCMLLVVVYCIAIIGAWMSMVLWWIALILTPILTVCYVTWRLTKGIRRSSRERRAKRLLEKELLRGRVSGY
jgi:membrane protein implicated in regulation of membrane protease activity